MSEKTEFHRIIWHAAVTPECAAFHAELAGAMMNMAKAYRELADKAEESAKTAAVLAEVMAKGVTREEYDRLVAVAKDENEDADR